MLHGWAGTVNLSISRQSKGVAGRYGLRITPPVALRRPRPGLKSLGPGGTVFGGGAVVAVEMEEVGDRIVNGEKALNLLR